MTPVLVNVTGSVWHRFTSNLSTMYYPSSLHQENLDIVAASFFHPECPLFPPQLKAMPARWATVMYVGRLFVYDVNKMLPRKPCCLCSLLLTQFICHRSWSLSQKLANKHSKCWWFSYHDMMFWEQVEIYHMQLQVWYFFYFVFWMKLHKFTQNTTQPLTDACINLSGMHLLGDTCACKWHWECLTSLHLQPLHCVLSILAPSRGSRHNSSQFFSPSVSIIPDPVESNAS